MTWEKVSWTNAQQVLEMISEDAVDDVPAADLALAPDAYCAGLVKANELSDATNFIGHALPRYEAIVWAAQTLMANGAFDRTHPLVVSILRWVDNPEDGLRRHIRDLAGQERKITPAKNLGNAIFFSGGSISEPDLPPVLPPSDACGKLAAASIIIAAYKTADPAKVFTSAIELGGKFAVSGVGG
jgi:hypothetical protein